MLQKKTTKHHTISDTIDHTTTIFILLGNQFDSKDHNVSGMPLNIISFYII